MPFYKGASEVQQAVFRVQGEGPVEVGERAFEIVSVEQLPGRAPGVHARVVGIERQCFVEVVRGAVGVLQDEPQAASMEIGGGIPGVLGNGSIIIK
jgi:hypothetical protein